MHTLDFWLCASCQRILAERVRIGDGLLQVACWGCGQVNILPVPVTMSDIPEGLELADVALPRLDADALAEMTRIDGTSDGGEMVVVVGPLRKKASRD